MNTMEPLEQWIWLPKDRYPQQQTTVYSSMASDAGERQDSYTVAVCERSYRFNQPICTVKLRFSADSALVLSCNGAHLATGPATAGGDFLFNDQPRQHYATEVTLHEAEFSGLAEGMLDFSAWVRMMPVQLCEYSQGHGGFFLTGHLTFADGTTAVILTDESWKIQRRGAYTKPNTYDGRIRPDDWMQAEVVPNIWNCLTAPIPPCEEHLLLPHGGEKIVLPAGESIDLILELPMIYAGYLSVAVQTESLIQAEIHCFETDEEGSLETFVFAEDTQYRGSYLHSAGGIRVQAVNRGNTHAVLQVGLIASHFPVTVQAKTETSDTALNLVTEVCTHTLKYCRQTHHLDSARHCEPLACTGDYYIESLMTAFTFGDQRLSAFDLRRTAQLLRYHDGRMFHTTYSLIWVQMLWDVYQFTGEKELLTDCADALGMLLHRFTTYLGENDLIETPPDYMFVDWLYPDAISTHHPPKALGQSCLNLFYYGALLTAEKIYRELGMEASAKKQKAAAMTLEAAILTHLYDVERCLFFEGLNTPTPAHLLGGFMPQNVEKRYYRKHANILAAYFGVGGKELGRALLRKVMEDDTLGEIQPYFIHYWLEAVYRHDLRETDTLRILQAWKQPVQECPKGLAEGFVKPEPTYSFDHSHAWGGTPAYALPKALSGLEMLAPGYQKIRLSPSLLGLDWANVEIPTPYGMIVIKMEKGKCPILHVPEAIDWEIN